MATSEETSIIRIDIDGVKHRLELSQSSSAAQLRTILSNRYQISLNTHFLDNEDYTVFPDDEESTPISQLLDKNNLVKLVTTKNESTTSILVPEMKSKISEKNLDLKYAQTLNQLKGTTLRELKLPGSTPTRSENQIVLATDLDRDRWEKIFRNCNLFRGIRMDEQTPKRAFESVLKFRQSDVNLLRFQVKDDSNIRAYIKDKEMESSFLSGRFFDGEINFSCPFIGIGINGEYSKSKTTTNIHKKTYLTYCFNFPRATVQLNLSYLEPTTHFIEAIDSVLQITKRNEQLKKLEEVLSIYGHVYPRVVILGGHLYHTEIHVSQEKAEEARKQTNAGIAFSTAIFEPVKIHVTAGSEKQSQNKFSEQSSFLTLEAVGGDTLQSRDPTVWTNTVADPNQWRVIEQDNYQSVITLLDTERQQSIKKIFDYDKIKKKLLSKLF